MSELANNIGDVLLNYRDWLLNESLQEEVLGLRLRIGGELHPEVGDDFPQVNAGNLPDVLILTRGHQYKEILEGLHTLEIFLQQCRRMLDGGSIRGEQCAKKLLETI